MIYGTKAWRRLYSGGSPACRPPGSWPRQLGRRGARSLDSAHSRCHRLRLPLRAGGALPCSFEHAS